MPAGALFGLAEDDRLIDLHRLAADRVEDALEPAAQVRHLAGDDAPVPAARLVEVEHLRGGVLQAEVAAEAGIELHDRGQRVVAEHVAELKPDAAADRGAEAVDADARRSAARRLRASASTCTARSDSVGLRDRRQPEGRVCEQRLHVARLAGRAAATRPPRPPAPKSGAADRRIAGLGDVDVVLAVRRRR